MKKLTFLIITLSLFLFLLVGCDDCKHKDVTTLEAVDAACTTVGLTEGKICSACNKVIIEQKEVPAIGHLWLEAECTVCGIQRESAGLEYNLSPDGTYYSVALGTCTDTQIFIPSIYQDLPVIKIERFAFQYCKALTSITIPDSITIIENSAFLECSNLDSVTFGESSELQSIGDWAFSGCSSLTNITIPNNIKSIGEYSFSICSGITSITIPNAVTNIGKNAFDLCSNLENITVSADNLYFTSTGGVLYDKDKSRLIKYPAGKSNSTFTVPNSVANIESSAFHNCTNLESIIFEENSKLKNIGEEAFSGAASLKAITLSNSVESIGSWAFENCLSLTNITIPDSVIWIDEYAFYNCTDLTIYCEAESKPSGWDNEWNSISYSNLSSCHVLWNCKSES